MFNNPGSPMEGIPSHWHYISSGLSDLHGDGRVHEYVYSNTFRANHFTFERGGWKISHWQEIFFLTDQQVKEDIFSVKKQCVIIIDNLALQESSSLLARISFQIFQLPPPPPCPSPQRQLVCPLIHHL